MNFNLFVVCTLFVTGLLLVPSVQGVNLLTIDTFVTGGSATSIIYSIPSYGVDGTWYSPYSTTGADPQVKFFSTSDALGGQRDLVLGYVDPVPIGSTAIVNIVSRRASISFPLNWIGGAYFQWDGFDDAGSGTAFPGARLNPGLTQSVDITFSGQAQGLALSITSDQDTDYRLTLVNSQGTRNQYRFILRQNEPAFTFVPLLYSSSTWSTPGFNFADVRGFEVQIQTGTDTSSNAPDTQFTPLFIFSYAISGNAGLRCNCLQSGLDSELANAQIDLFTAANVFVKSTNTNANGDYTLWALNPATYNVCFHDTTALLCSSSPRCVSVTIDPLSPANVYTVNFVKTQATTFTIPPDVNGDCADCKIPDGTTNCPAYATTTGCQGGTTIVTNFSDVTTGNTCQLNIVRTWTSPDDGSKKTQRLTYTDTTKPVFTVPPQDLTQDCNAVTTTINAWVTANAFSTVTDNCSPTTVTNNWNGASVGQCNSATVTFTLRDTCGNVANPLTATYRIRDVSAPLITTAATNSGAECDLKQGADQTALNAWVASRGGAVATDNCATTISWTNNFTPLTSGCLAVRTVTFTANDGCGNSAPTTASFTISDSKNPVITTGAQAASAQCSGQTSATQAFTTWRNSHGGAVATDACVVSDTSLTWTDDFTGVVSGGCNNAFPVTFTVNDLCGFSARTTATFTVLDNTGPTLVTPAAPQTIECGSANIDTAYNTWLANNGGAVATDACTAVVWSNNAGPTPTNGCNSVSTVTFRATDSCNNAAVQTTATFTVRDTTSPSFVTPPSNSGQECSGNVSVGFNAWLSSSAGATATDTCSLPVTITNDFPANGTPAVGCSATTTVKFTAVDACNRSSQPLSATYTVTDTTPPTINPGAQDVNKECNTGTNGQDYQTFLNTHGGAVATDFCSSFTWSNDGPAQLTFTCSVSQRVTFTARDACGNAATTTATFSVNDTTAPTIVQAASDRTTQCSTGGSGTNTDLTNWLNSRGGATASDNCGQVTWTNDFTALTVQSSCTSFATVTFLANDGCGHSVATTATFTVTDNIGPTINPPAQALTVQCDPDSNDSAYTAWVADHGGARATDNCVPADQLLWTVNDPVPLSDSCSTQSVTFTVTDGCGSASVTTALFTIIDTNKPTFSTPPQNVQYECDGAGNVQQYNDWVSSFGGAIADDVCATLLVYATNAPPTGPVGCGSQPQTITVTDECNNAAIASSVFTIVDTIAPTIDTPAVDTQIQCNPATNTADINAFLAAKGGATASDSCYATSSLSWSNNYIGLSTAACNPTARVIFTVSDPCGNKATTTASVTIVDTLVPILSSAATPATFECDTDENPVQISTYVTTHGGAQASDTCSSITWSNNFVNPPNACVGPLPIIFTASDACGNRISSTGSIEIIDSVAPAFVNFPADVTVGCDKSTDPDATGIPDWDDACTTEITPTYSDTSFQKPTEKFCPGDVIITRTWTLVDSCGNSNSKDQIIVEEITRPVGPCLPSECPPCELVECCTNPLADIECNPVACTPVHCSAVPCSAVPCIPRSCGVPPTPTGKPEGPVPLPSVLPAPSCEPVYIYVFDDDGEDVPVEPIIVYTTKNDSASLGLSLISLVIILFVTIF